MMLPLLLLACAGEEDCATLDVDACESASACRTIDGKALSDDGAGGMCLDGDAPSEALGCLGGDTDCASAEGYAAPANDPTACTWFSSLCFPEGWVTCEPAVDSAPECDTLGDSGDTATDTADTADSATDTADSARDTADTADTGSDLLDVSAWDPYVTPVIEVSPVPLVAGDKATVTYRGDLAGESSLTLHYGFNGWNEVSGISGLVANYDTGDEDWYIDAPMAEAKDGSWQVTVPLPTDGEAMHMVVHAPEADTWDNNDMEDYAESLQFPYIGPYLSWNGETEPTTGIVVSFVTAVPCLGTVEYGTTEEFGSVAVGEDFGSNHHIALTDLSPDTRYTYRVYDSRGRVSDTAAFTTVADETERLTMLVMGDMQDGGGDQRWSDVAAEAYASHSDSDLVFLVGDMAYNDKPGHWWTFFHKGRDLFRHVPLMPVPGNHDTPGVESSSNLGHFVGFFDLPWADGAGTDSDSRWQAEVGPATLLGFNSEDPEGFIPDTGDQFTWVAEVLEDVESTWTFAAWHNPPYNVGTRHYLEQHQFREVTRHFDGLVDWVFGGHEHLAQRIVPMQYNATAASSESYGRGADQGVGYLVAPPAGNAPATRIVAHDSEDARYRDRLAFPSFGSEESEVESELGFVRVEVDGEKITLSIYGMGDLSDHVAAHVREEVSYTR